MGRVSQGHLFGGRLVVQARNGDLDWGCVVEVMRKV